MAMLHVQEVEKRNVRRRSSYILAAFASLVGGLAFPVTSSAMQPARQVALASGSAAGIHEVASGGQFTLSGNLPTPPWWNGFCDDGTYFNATGIHSHQLGSASFLGMVACGPRPIGDGAPDVSVYFNPVIGN